MDPQFPQKPQIPAPQPPRVIQTAKGEIILQNEFNVERPQEKRKVRHQSCEMCRQKRSKCDGAFPCGACTTRQTKAGNSKIDTVTCVYSQIDMRSTASTIKMIVFARKNIIFGENLIAHIRVALQSRNTWAMSNLQNIFHDNSLLQLAPHRFDDEYISKGKNKNQLKKYKDELLAINRPYLSYIAAIEDIVKTERDIDRLIIKCTQEQVAFGYSNDLDQGPELQQPANTDPVPLTMAPEDLFLQYDFTGPVVDYNSSAQPTPSSHSTNTDSVPLTMAPGDSFLQYDFTSSAFDYSSSVQPTQSSQLIISPLEWEIIPPPRRIRVRRI